MKAESGDPALKHPGALYQQAPIPPMYPKY
jgi:hypothetical protein